MNMLRVGVGVFLVILGLAQAGFVVLKISLPYWDLIQALILILSGVGLLAGRI